MLRAFREDIIRRLIPPDAQNNRSNVPNLGIREKRVRVLTQMTGQIRYRRLSNEVHRKVSRAHEEPDVPHVVWLAWC